MWGGVPGWGRGHGPCPSWFSGFCFVLPARELECERRVRRLITPAETNRAGRGTLQGGRSGGAQSPSAIPVSLSSLCTNNSFSAENEDKSLHSVSLCVASPSLCGAGSFHYKAFASQMACHMSLPLSYHLVSRFCQVLGVKA